MRQLYVSERLSIHDIARRYHMSNKGVRALMDEYGIRVRKGGLWPVREVDHFEEQPYRTTMSGKVLTKTVAILECGHKQKVWNKKLPYETEYRRKMGCRACGVIEERNPVDGGEEHEEGQRPDDGGRGDPGGVEGAGPADQP